MRKYILVAAAIAMATAADTSDALASTPGYYFSGMGGASFMPSLGLKDSAGTSASSFDTGYALGAAAGYDFGNGWRFELSSLYQLSNLDQFNGVTATGHLWSTSLMANVTRDLTEGTQFTPYVGAGLGFQNIGGTINGYSGDKWRPAYQLEAGLRDNLTPQISLFTEYRFSQSEATKLVGTANSANQHFSNHALMMGITYHLGQE